ncbi:MAG: mechanosensitive ion channel family protein [Saprospiraceae bacterium]
MFNKILVLAFKAIGLLLLVLMRMGELDIAYLYQTSKYRDSIDNYVKALSSLTIFYLILDFIQFFALWWYRRRQKIRGEDNFTIGVGHIYSILLAFGLIGGLLALFNVGFRELFTSISIIFAGLAILSKDYVSNLINGMILTFSGQISIGDIVKIGQHKGKITDITLQNIHLLNNDDDIIYIPNNTAANADLINYTKRPIKRSSVDFEIDLKLVNTIEELEDQLIASLAPFHDRIRPESYYLRVAEVRKDSLALKFQYILNEPDKDLERTIRRRTIRKLVEILSARKRA